MNDRRTSEHVRYHAPHSPAPTGSTQRHLTWWGYLVITLVVAVTLAVVASVVDAALHPGPRPEPARVAVCRVLDAQTGCTGTPVR